MDVADVRYLFAYDRWAADLTRRLPLPNHGRQHRSEAALLLTQAGRSPHELDRINDADTLVADGHV